MVGGGGGEQDEIAFLKDKAKSGRNWMLLSTTLLEEAKVEMFRVCQAPRLAVALQLIMHRAEA